MLTARVWGEVWHLDGLAGGQRNAVPRDREKWDHWFTDWGHRPTALVPEDESELYRTVPLEEAVRAPLLVR